jgi:hypothetical protein
MIRISSLRSALINVDVILFIFLSPLFIFRKVIYRASRDLKPAETMFQIHGFSSLDVITFPTSMGTIRARNADINGDGKASLQDLVIMANHYGQHYP